MIRPRTTQRQSAQHQQHQQPIGTTASNSASSNIIGLTVPGGSSSSAAPRGRPRKQNFIGGLTTRLNSNSNTGTTKIPFSLIVIVMVLSFAAIGVGGIYSMMYLTNSMNKPPPSRHLPEQEGMLLNHLRNLASPDEAAQLVQGIKDDFSDRYGGTSTAWAMLDRGIHSYGSIDATAWRMVDASLARRPFVMGFSGYSITVGRGNFFNQSFPFVVQRILAKPMESLLGTTLTVRNAAIGGIPSFPYGFCMEHFLGADLDVVSWDYSMNEGPKDASVLESFVRQATQQLPNRPMLIVMDTNPTRTNLLQDYATRHLLQDAISVGKQEVIEKTLFEKQPVPKGLQQWDEFGAPPGCPGRGSWHPKKMEHELMGWMIAMHFLQALERAFELLRAPTVDLQKLQQHSQERKLAAQADPRFPPPTTKVPQNPAKVTELLFGHKLPDSKDINAYRIKDISCRTSFLPATDHTKVIPSVVVSGLTPNVMEDIMIQRPDSSYEKGWVLDVSKVERDTKRKVESCGGLGYVDMKIALYGIPSSGPLRLWLPFEKGPSHDHHDHNDDSNSVASHWFDNLILCEANEKRSADACQLDRDLDVTVGGVPVTKIDPLKGAGEYLRRTTCVAVSIPSDAKVTRFDQVQTINGRPLSTDEKKEKFGEALNNDSVGLIVDIKATSKVTRSNGACCLSHIVWEQH